jgi:hypothetical protein
MQFQWTSADHKSVPTSQKLVHFIITVVRASDPTPLCTLYLKQSPILEISFLFQSFLVSFLPSAQFSHPYVNQDTHNFITFVLFLSQLHFLSSVSYIRHNEMHAQSQYLKHSACSLILLFTIIFDCNRYLHLVIIT